MLGSILTVVAWLGMSQHVYATGTMYLTPGSATLTVGSEVTLALRINPGTPIRGVQAEIGYDNAKLQFISLGENGTAFPDTAEQNTVSNPITLTRTTSSSVDSDSLIVTLKFKALASSGSSSITVAGNAADSSAPTNPATQGATITFASPGSQPSPAPAPASPNPSTPNPSGSSQQGSGNSSTTPPQSVTGQPDTDSLPVDSDTQSVTHAQAMSKRLWWLLAGVVVIGAVAMGIWLVRRRQAAPADLAAEHPIDTTWAIKSKKYTPRDAQTEQLLQRTPGVTPPDPGSIVTPRGSDDTKKPS